MTTRMGRWAPTVVVPAMLIALAGCSDDGGGEGGSGGGDGGEGTGASEAAESPSETATSTGTITPPDLPVPPRVGQAQGAVADVEWDQSSCGTEPGEQTVTGTLTNSTDERTGYLVQISWTNETSDTLGLGYDVVRGARPGQEAEWEVVAEVPEGATQCVIFAQRGVIREG